jgi:hypothetical protein
MNLASGVIQIQTSLDEDKLYIKIIALDRIYNFVAEKFLNWNRLGSQNTIVSTPILKFKI